MNRMSRRRLLEGALAVAGIGSLQLPLSLVELRPARADGGATALVVIAVVEGCLQIAGALASLGGSGGGLGARLAAMQTALNTILTVQKETLGAIVAVDDHLQEIQKEIPDLFRLAEYRTAYLQAKEVYDRFGSVARQTLKVPRSHLSERDFALVDSISGSVLGAVSKLEGAVQEQVSGMPGISAALYAYSSARLLTELCWFIRKLDLHFPAATKRPSWDIKIVLSDPADQLRRSVIPAMKTQMIPRLRSEQEALYDKAMDELKKNVPYGSDFMATLASSNVFVPVEPCLDTGYSEQRYVYGQRRTGPTYCSDHGGSLCGVVVDSAKYNLMNFERRHFDVSIGRVEPTKATYVISYAAKAPLPGWFVPPSDRTRPKFKEKSGHGAGQENVPTAGVDSCKPVSPGGVGLHTYLDDQANALTITLRKHAQAVANIASLTSIDTGLADLDGALSDLFTRKISNL